MRILVVEDNSLGATSLTALLHMEGHAAYYVGDGLSALTLLAAPGELPWEAIILDLCLPGMDGETLLDRLQEREDWRSIPVIVRTAAGPDRAAHVRARFPRIRLMLKPTPDDELLDCLTEIEEESRYNDGHG